MPKHSPAIAKNMLAQMRKTAKIRKTKPDWVSAFATGTVEGGKFSAVCALKLPKAQSDLRNYGITQTKADQLKDVTAGFVWFEDGALWLSVQKGSFANARKTMLGYFKDFKAGNPQIREGEPLSADRIAALEGEDDDALALLAEGEEDEVEADDAMAAPDEEPTPAEDMVAAPAEDTAPAAKEHAPARAPLSEAEVKAVKDSTGKVASVLQAALARVAREKMPEAAEMARQLEERLTARLAETEEALRPDLLETAPSRMLMEESRAAILGWTGRTDIDDVLDLYEPSHPVGKAEVANHFVDLGSHVLAQAGRTANVSRRLVEMRVDGLYQDGDAANARFAALERLFKVLLPVMGDAARLEQTFGVKSPAALDDIPGPERALGAVQTTLFSALSQIEACRAAHEAGLQAEGETLSAEENAFFDGLGDELTARTNAFLSAAQALVKAGNADGLAAEVAALTAHVNDAFAGTDNCPSDHAPTGIRRLYAEALVGIGTARQQAA
ncbi:hypothetical protein [Falsirhodobacter sp. 20TX0035]|uniref:hypothetical protein n=1 Tax=Falsirhodobacter sp. 20TX0035 TaxID=3022019 RepID=UPI00232B2598|nr:hypothetical protein [Falsirhodobacter sp. 20TX0035]MDB6453072.1 hypothetical protein [Falsirhodobacter sp. 20TX0035]